TRTLVFQSAGTWYNFLSNGTGSGLNGSTGSMVTLTNAGQNITLQPGEYHVYLDRQATLLSLKLLSFTGKRNKDNIALSWVTTNEVNVRHFVIERSFNGTDFSDVATIAASN